MTVTIKSETINGYYIEITQEKFSSAYDVSASEEIDSLWYTVNENTYATIEAAKKRYSYLKSQAKKGYIPTSSRY